MQMGLGSEHLQCFESLMLDEPSNSARNYICNLAFAVIALIVVIFYLELVLEGSILTVDVCRFQMQY